MLLEFLRIKIRLQSSCSYVNYFLQIQTYSYVKYYAVLSLSFTVAISNNPYINILKQIDHVLTILCTIYVKQTNTTSSTRESWHYCSISWTSSTTDACQGRASFATQHVRWKHWRTRSSWLATDCHATPSWSCETSSTLAEHTACYQPFSSVDSSELT